MINDKILTLTEKEKADYNEKLAGLREQERELLEAQENATQADLKKDFEELEDLLAWAAGQSTRHMSHLAAERQAQRGMGNSRG